MGQALSPSSSRQRSQTPTIHNSFLEDYEPQQLLGTQGLNPQWVQEELEDGPSHRPSDGIAAKHP